MTNDEIMSELKSDSALNKARREFSSWSAKIDQLSRQKEPISPVEMRGLEFCAVKAIMKAYGPIVEG